MFSNRFFIIKALSNMHVGSGERSFSVVDNMVQRDEITELPIIHGSSLKGAIRDFAETYCKSGNLSAPAFRTIFGDDGKGSQKKTTPGEFRFLQADLLALPVRSNKQPFYLATTMSILSNIISLANTLGAKPKIQLPAVSHPEADKRIAYVTDDNTGDLLIEDFDCKPCKTLKNNAFKTLLDYEHIALFTDETFKSLTSVLPVIARNKIGEDGTSENLFYEEVVPRQSLFAFFIGIPDETVQGDKEIRKGFDDFIGLLTSENVQMGANASIGYGLTKIRELSEVKK